MKCFFPEIRWRPKKKRSLPKFNTIFARNLSDLFVLALFCLIIQRSNLDGWVSKSRWGDAKPRWGDASPYNLSTDQWYKHITNHPQCTVQSIVTERKIDYRQMPPEKKIRIWLVCCTSRLCSKRRLRVSKLSKSELSWQAHVWKRKAL